MPFHYLGSVDNETRGYCITQALLEDNEGFLPKPKETLDKRGVIGFNMG